VFLLAVTGELGDNVLFPAPIAEPKMVVVWLWVGQRVPFDTYILSRDKLNGKTKNMNSNYIWIWSLRRQSLFRTPVLIVSAFLFYSSSVDFQIIFISLCAFVSIFSFVLVFSFVFIYAFPLCLCLCVYVCLSYVCMCCVCMCCVYGLSMPMSYLCLCLSKWLSECLCDVYVWCVCVMCMSN
jgi:hypothetical protein